MKSLSDLDGTLDKGVDGQKSPGYDKNPRGGMAGELCVKQI